MAPASSRTIKHSHLQCIQIMSTNGDDGPLPAEVLVQLVLQVYEALVAVLIKGHASKNRTYNERPNQSCLWLDYHAMTLLAWSTQCDY